MLVVTLGDPHSINIEMVVGLASRFTASGGTQNMVLLGSWWHWQEQLRLLKCETPQIQSIKLVTADNIPLAPVKDSSHLFFVDTGGSEKSAEKLSTLERGAVAYGALKALRLAPFIEAKKRAKRLAVITAPIDKAACRQAGFSFDGQTEFFEDLWQTKAVMILAGPRLRVGLVTNHLPLKEVVPRLSTELIETKICLFAKSLKEDFNIKSPRIAVCGVNPHAGDNGLFGDEDRRLILPVVKKLQAKWQGQVTLQGPMPADTVFHFAFQGQYDGVLAMYHDQGLGPLKIVHFDTAVNLSGGLPHLRVSPDHGPAADLYLSQKASPKSWQSCYAVACQYLNGDMQQRSAT